MFSSIGRLPGIAIDRVSIDIESRNSHVPTGENRWWVSESVARHVTPVCITKGGEWPIQRHKRFAKHDGGNLRMLMVEEGLEPWCTRDFRALGRTMTGYNVGPRTFRSDGRRRTGDDAGPAPGAIVDWSSGRVGGKSSLRHFGGGKVVRSREHVE